MGVEPVPRHRRASRRPPAGTNQIANYPWLDTGHAAAGGARILTAAHHGVGKRNAGAACQPRRHRRPRGAQPCRCVGSPSEAPPQPHPWNTPSLPPGRSAKAVLYIGMFIIGIPLIWW